MTESSNHFVALTECHLLNPAALAETFGYYPQAMRWWKSVRGVLRAWSGPDPKFGEPPIAETLVKHMDEADVDVAFCLREGMMDLTGGTFPLSTNQWMIDQVKQYPGRLYLEAMVGPILRRGVEHAIWELEHLVTNYDARLCKVYQPEDLAPLDDKRMWPFYEKACELDVPLTVHTGMAYVCPQPNFHTHVDTLDRICLDFPELKIIAYHMGWPQTEELIGLAGKHEHLYLSMSGIVGWYERAPYRGYHAIGTALQWVEPHKLVMGLDVPMADTKRIVDWVRNLQMPDDLREQYGYDEITDEIRAGILGTNLAKLTKIEPVKARSAEA